MLACRKCQKKLKKDKHLRAMAKLKKLVKACHGPEQDESIHVLNVPCMDLCPKGGVTVCLPASSPVELFILRSEADIGKLCGVDLH